MQGAGLLRAMEWRGVLVQGGCCSENAGMFFGKNRKHFDEEVDKRRTLCKAVRTERGPCQRVVVSLGKFTDQDLAAG